MIFGKHMNRYYLRFGWLLLLGIAALVAVDYLARKDINRYRALIAKLGIRK